MKKATTLDDGNPVAGGGGGGGLPDGTHQSARQGTPPLLEEDIARWYILLEHDVRLAKGEASVASAKRKARARARSAGLKLEARVRSSKREFEVRGARHRLRDTAPSALTPHVAALLYHSSTKRKNKDSPRPGKPFYKRGSLDY